MSFGNERDFIDFQQANRRCCMTCRHYHPKEQVCFEGGYSEIGDPNRELTEEECNAWRAKDENITNVSPDQ